MSTPVGPDAGRSRMPRAGDPFGIGPVTSLVTPIASVVGLVLVAILTVNLLTGHVPFLSSGNGSHQPGGGNGGANPTPAPSNVVVVPPEVKFKGTIVYAKAGNIWTQTTDGAKQLTTGGSNSMPTFSADGKSVFFIRSTRGSYDWSYRGTPMNHYWVDTPTLMQVPTDGSADPVALADGSFKKGPYTWAYWMRDPAASPDGKRLAIVSDAPNPDQNDVVLQFFDLTTKKLTQANVADSGLGHQDPAWRPDGRFLLYVKNERDGARGAPVISRLEVATGRTRTMTTAGYVNPCYSPDGRYIAATRSTSLGTDVVILDGATGQELQRVTTDGSAFDPIWSPAGDGIAYLHLVGQTVDLKLAHLDPNAATPTVTNTTDLTEVSGLDPASRPDWFIPADQLPAPSPTPTAPASPSGSGSSGSASPSSATP